jgi:endonuclease YncB( thermonuclease family)
MSSRTAFDQFLIASTVAGAIPAAAAPSIVVAGCPAAGTELATVAEASDGDTVRLTDGTVVRLAGIDVPEPPLVLATGKPWPPADAAGAELRRLAEGGTVGLAPTSDSPDRYGRRHAFVFLSDGRSVEGEMVAAGVARARWLPGDGLCFQDLLARERQGRAAHGGLWASPDSGVLEADDPSLLQRSGLNEVVEGRPVSVGHGAPLIFLDFGRDYRRDFIVKVSPQVAQGLTAAGVSVDGLVGKPVRVRGVIEDSNGPAIRLNDAAEIEVIDDEASSGAKP